MFAGMPLVRHAALLGIAILVLVSELRSMLAVIYLLREVMMLTGRACDRCLHQMAGTPSIRHSSLEHLLQSLR